MGVHAMATPSRAAYWAEVLRDYRRSGLTRRQFCHKRGASYHSLRWWVGRTHEVDPGETRRDTSLGRRGRSPARPGDSSARFLPVRLVAGAAAADRAPIQVILAGGRRIAVPPDRTTSMG